MPTDRPKAVSRTMPHRGDAATGAPRLAAHHAASNIRSQWLSLFPARHEFARTRAEYRTPEFGESPDRHPRIRDITPRRVSPPQHHPPPHADNDTTPPKSTAVHGFSAVNTPRPATPGSPGTSPKQPAPHNNRILDKAITPGMRHTLRHRPRLPINTLTPPRPDRSPMSRSPADQVVDAAQQARSSLCHEIASEERTDQKQPCRAPGAVITSLDSLPERNLRAPIGNQPHTTRSNHIRRDAATRRPSPNRRTRSPDQTAETRSTTTATVLPGLMILRN